MVYDPAETSVLDRIRGLVGDTDSTGELMSDATYQSIIDRFENWKRAAAEIALRVARKIEADPTSLAKAGKSLSWSDRTKSLYEMAKRLISEADDEDAAAVEVPTALPYMPALIPIDWR